MNQRRRDLIAIVASLLFAGVVTAQLAPPSTTSNAATRTQVYEQRLPTLRFSHAKHADQSCTSCHAAALTSQRTEDRLTPPMAACVTCHNERPEAPSASQCGACHVGMVHVEAEEVSTAAQWQQVRPAPMIPPQPQASLRFDHSKHVPLLGGESSCANCHGAGQGGEPTMPSEQSCTTCHNGVVAPSTCTTCHVTGENGKLRGRPQSHPQSQVQVQVQGLRPDSHDANFLKRHASVAKSSMQDCMACHVEQDCAACHNAVMAPPFSVHPPNFLTVHAVDARMNAGNCSDCHTVQTFCTSCHVRANVTTVEPHDPPARRRFHPPGWLESSAANNHGVMARRDIMECASCHSEQDCITCHTAINPHPPEFALSCRTMMQSNASACVKCHTDLAALRAICP